MHQSTVTLALSDVVYKYDDDTDIALKYLTKSLLSILLQLFFFLNKVLFTFRHFFGGKTTYEWFLILIHLKVVLSMPLLRLTDLLIDYDLTQGEHLKLFDYWCFLLWMQYRYVNIFQLHFSVKIMMHKAIYCH